MWPSVIIKNFSNDKIQPRGQQMLQQLLMCCPALRTHAVWVWVLTKFLDMYNTEPAVQSTRWSLSRVRVGGFSEVWPIKNGSGLVIKKKKKNSYLTVEHQLLLLFQNQSGNIYDIVAASFCLISSAWISSSRYEQTAESQQHVEMCVHPITVEELNAHVSCEKMWIISLLIKYCMGAH